MTTRLVAALSSVALVALVATSACTGSTGDPGGPVLDGGLPAPAPDGAVLDGGAAPDAEIPDAPQVGTLTADLASIEIGAVEIGRQATASVVLTNHGTGNVAINTAAITTGGQFQVGGFDCPASLAPNEHCTVSVLFAPIHVGAATSALVVPSSVTTVQVPVHGVGQRRITVSLIGNGTGGVTSSPAGIDCPTNCTGLFSTDVVLTAAPSANNDFVGWSPICDGRATCTVPADDASLNVAASFDTAPDGFRRITVDFAGGSIGLTFIQTDTVFLFCRTNPCTLDVPDGTSATLWGYTPSTFAGWSGGCVSAGHDCFLPAVTANLTATVHYNRDPRELTTIFPRAAVTSVAFASDGALLVADHLGVSKLALATGTQVWTTPITGGAHDLAVDDAGNVYGAGGAGAGNAVFSLSPTGAVRWTKAISPTTLASSSVQSLVQVSADAAVVAVHASGGARVLDAAGADRFTISGLGAINDGFAVAADGTIAIGTDSVFQPGIFRDVHQFSSTGAPLTTIENLADEVNVSIAFDAGDAVCGLTVGFETQWVSRRLPDGSEVFRHNGPRFDERAAPGAIGVDVDGDLVVAHGETEGGAGGLHLEVFTPTGTSTFVHDKPAFDTLPPLVVDGVDMQAFAVERHARHVAVGGVYNMSQPWLQVYEMPTP